MILSMSSGLAICIVLLAMAGPAAGQEIRPTLDKITETGVMGLTRFGGGVRRPAIDGVGRRRLRQCPV